ncbi:hypothetical protein OE88DRAFT_1806677 [Heliocybe sulcata]|uniref:Uncharacterized protein n=1 Tax=Heliocybe sulcata TaxID=5364 RepID=A0A5C3NAD4_9AGAM|nr:hypothetical protein OE88DRAFT_1806677 [Heliocybe sulcata]
MSQPRPILKPSRAARPRHVQVHFPPSPTLTRSFPAHSPASYDRSPIVVAPNACALPARGCPGRTYPPADTAGRHVHPRVAQPVSDKGGSSADDIPVFSHRPSHSRSRSPASLSPNIHPVPALIPDLSSESDESDSSIVPLLCELDVSPSSPWFRPPLAIPNSQATYRSLDDFLTEPDLAFLPHSPHSLSLPYSPPPVEERPKLRRKSRSRTRVVGGDEEDGRFKAIRACRLKSCELEVKDEGCLAGF